MQVFCIAPVMKPHFDAAGITVVTDKTVKCDFSVCAFEHHVPEVKENYLTGTPAQDLDLLDKTVLTTAFAQIGAPTLPLIPFTSADQIAALNGKPFILKPKFGAGSDSINPLGYKIFSNVTDFNQAVANICPNFWQLQTNPDIELYIQQSVVAPTDRAILTIANAFVNGAGIPIFTSFMESPQVNGHSVDTLTEDIPEADVARLQNYITAVINLRQLKNCFFMMQFIRAPGGEWYPIDLSYRPDYTHRSALVKINPQYCGDLIKYTYDQIDNVTSIPTDKYSFQRVISINAHSHALGAYCESQNVWPNEACFIPSHIYRVPFKIELIFLTYGASKAIAKTKMDAFEAVATTL